MGGVGGGRGTYIVAYYLMKQYALYFFQGGVCGSWKARWIRCYLPGRFYKNSNGFLQCDRENREDLKYLRNVYCLMTNHNKDQNTRTGHETCLQFTCSLEIFLVFTVFPVLILLLNTMCWLKNRERRTFPWPAWQVLNHFTLPNHDFYGEIICIVLCCCHSNKSALAERLHSVIS